MKSNIYLCGFMGVGKSTVGALFGKRIGWKFIDLDNEIETQSGNAVSILFREKGEPYFRGMESECLKKLSSFSRQVIALGGGTVLTVENREIIQRTGICIYLKASLKELTSRLEKEPFSKRPLLEENDLSSLMQSRECHYSASGSIQIHTDKKTPDEVVQEILLHLNFRL